MPRHRYPCLGSHNIFKRRRRKARIPLCPLFGGFSGELISDDLIYTPEIVQVSCDFQRVIREQFHHSETLLQMSSREFEEFVAELWKRFGYDVELTKRTRDGGYDVIAVKHAEVISRLLIECKRYDPENKIGVSIVRSLYGIKTHHKATKAILATTSHFTKDAEEFVNEHRWELEAKDHEGVIDWVKKAVTLERK